MLKVRHEAFKYYFFFMQERMAIFWKKYNQAPYPWTQDTTLEKYKFTNVYRACDRVSQYLIKEVIYGSSQVNLSAEDILLRILVFKVFNRIDTWEYLESKIGQLNQRTFKVDLITKIFNDRIKDQPIFNGAYIMTGSHQNYKEYSSKHERWLRMIENEVTKNQLLSKVVRAKSLESVYNRLLTCPFIGPFLAYQYTIDFNYSEVINFSEDSFVKAGIGAIRGIQKCFDSIGGYSNEDIIKYTQENAEEYRKKYGFNDFRNLFGRAPTLIDYQNCFCETDKLLRAKLPNLNLENSRIKQKYKNTKSAITYFFPPKWGLNDKIET